MAFGKLARFLTEPEDYDFVYESGASLPIDPLERYIFYKASDSGAIESKYYQDGNKKTVEFVDNVWKSYPELDGFDCDSCHLAQYIYRVLWGKQAKQIGEEMLSTCPDFFNKGENEFSFAGDTINSVATIFNKAKRTTTNKAIHQYANNELGVVNKELINYISVYHTIGNFCLVPSVFNRDRGNYQQDYWDNSLDYLKNNSKAAFHYGFVSNSHFNRYINYFFLWDYAPKGDISMYNPNMLNKNSEKDKIDFFLTTATRRIKRRGIFMVAMLKTATQQPEIYHELMDKYFKEDKNIHSSTKNVLLAIRDDNNFCEIKNILCDAIAKYTPDLEEVQDKEQHNIE